MIQAPSQCPCRHADALGYFATQRVYFFQFFIFGVQSPATAHIGLRKCSPGFVFAGEVTRNLGAGDAAGGAAAGVEVGLGAAVGAEDPGRTIDDEAALGVEQGAGDADRVIGRLQRRGRGEVAAEGVGGARRGGSECLRQGAPGGS